MDNTMYLSSSLIFLDAMDIKLPVTMMVVRTLRMRMMALIMTDPVDTLV